MVSTDNFKRRPSYNRGLDSPRTYALLPTKKKKGVPVKGNSLKSLVKVPGSFDLTPAAGKLLLVGTSLLWGTFGVSVRFIYSQPGAPHPSLLTFLRKALSVAFFILLSLKNRDLKPSTKSVNDDKNWVKNPTVWRKGGELGLLTFLGTAFKVIGLEHTPASRAGFELQLSSIIVPFLDSLSGQSLPAYTFTAAVLASCGLVIIAISSSSEDDGHDVDSCLPLPGVTCPAGDGYPAGDVFVLFAAFFYALNTVRTSANVKVVPAVQLTSANMFVSMLMSALWVGSDLWNMSQNGEPLGDIWTSWDRLDVLSAVLFSGVFAGAIATLLQNYGQSVVSPSEAQVVYSLQSVWSALFAATSGETIPTMSYVGGIIIIISTMLTNLKK